MPRQLMLLNHYPENTQSPEQKRERDQTKQKREKIKTNEKGEKSCDRVRPTSTTTLMNIISKNAARNKLS